MTLRSAAFFAIIGTGLWTLRLLMQLVTAISGVAGGYVAFNILLISLIEFLAALSLLVFFVVFYKSKP